MRDGMERLVLLPFAVGCMSESGVGVASSPPARRSRAPAPRSPPISLFPLYLGGNGETEREGSDDETSSDEGTESSVSLLALPKSNISSGIHRMFKGFKNFSHLFIYKEDMEEGEMDIEIGLPTDVKHVGHIGWDGCTANSDHPSKSCSWDNLFIDPNNMNMLSNRDLFQQLASPSPTAADLEPSEGRPQNLQTSDPEPCAYPIPLKG